ncbi:3',5'-cyclic adenosine monophosphate phosphodiesterase CpdA [Methanobrevibacter cuticularis]|uniref:3',5'-cyclic adenosine monophosphate phosphodiesterase CpdA n=1 Tax=Methanobrevibacter cuticularis TaxID=47311 RepID=A0A166CU43_9EURY|nr:metallophosphoesterase [Methanobrevibacter cuticularis]KZX16827.1 3',5'-cyclic adenosine monophosphate phosphodiesterase CpdA [Methanobrevibacter cuticularis]
MKILAITDVHSENNPKFDNYIKNNDLDLVIVAGDITNFGPPEFATEFLNNITSLGIEVIAIPGNCDTKESILAIEESDAIFNHNNLFINQNIAFHGFGGSNPTPFDTPFEFDDEELYENINDLFNQVVSNQRMLNILITHAPPLNCEADKLEDGSHVGSNGVRKIIEEHQPDISICGHIHEARSIDKIDETLVINPGMLKDNHGSLIEISKDLSDFKVDLVEF